MTAEDRSRELAVVAACAATDRKARDVIALDVSERLVLTDVFVVSSGTTERQVHAIVDAVEEAMHHEGVKAVRREGITEGRWALLDYGEVVVHVQHEEEREFYALARLWKDCPAVELPEDARGVDDAEEGEEQRPTSGA